MRAPIPARLLLLAMVCFAAACGGSGDDTGGAAPATTTTAASGTTAAASQACADAAALKASMAELDGIDPPEAGKAGIQAALEKVINQPGRAQGQRQELSGAARSPSWTVPWKPSRPPSPGSAATAWPRPCRRSSATCSGSTPPGRRCCSRSTRTAASSRASARRRSTRRRRSGAMGRPGSVAADQGAAESGTARGGREWIHRPVRVLGGRCGPRRLQRQPRPDWSPRMVAPPPC